MRTEPRSQSTLFHFSPRSSPLRQPETSSKWTAARHFRGSSDRASKILPTSSGW